MVNDSKKPVRVRFAPSPTGPLHIGGARTTLFNWIFAKKYNGRFILRIEDTDVERSKKEYEEEILNGLKWLGLDWDEGPDIGGEFGPYRQSEKIDIYEKYLKKLIDEEKAYYCFCSKEELEADRQAMLSQGLAPKYSGRCRNLSKEESFRKIEKGESFVIRFKIPAQELEFNDLIRGKIRFNSGLFGDIIVAKGLREPLYNFAVAIDDYEMQISHVIRGEDHLSNTPKQMLMREALGFEHPKYAHLPLILAPDRSKLSKRYLETSLSDYKRQGYLPEAINNFLALLGWHPENDREIFSQEEIIKEFDLKRVQKAGAVFNIEKLEWLNAQYIKKTDSKELVKKLTDFIPSEWQKDKAFISKMIEAEKERIKKLTDFKELAGFFFELPEYDGELLKWQEQSFEKTASNLKTLSNLLESVEENNFSKNILESIIMPIAETIGRGESLWPLRAALSGQKASPGPFEILEILGKTESLKRINIAINKII
ncbi:glutamate--tRNA ligase [Candidatus Wolfebacteria bacterium RIFCSPLOWO2_01_FULL_38_11]|uniref:Glutamate--tRNA ligase n=3 Tax=Candidatus Wolfeibacteriota TaxID=1752735 RepID=A0A1F8DS00_9BACT|nr:MAG: glutamate--tRNA ligase [Candidatus Wolfebacteria bacterium RIFCSPLOWO2_01_FULL_38_11]